MLSSQAFRLVRAWRALALLNLTLLTSVFVVTAATRGAVAQQGPVNGMRPSDPARFALVGAKVIPAPGEKLESATILVRDGVIEAVGTAPPRNAATAEPSESISTAAVCVP